MSQAYEAMMFARNVHKDQQRKYTGNPYADHLAEVAGIAASVPAKTVGLPTIMSVAWLHDCLEDQPQQVDYGCLLREFGMLIAEGVRVLSNLETGNRAARKAASRERLSKAADWIQTIKCADLISNTSSIVLHDKKFAGVYLEEKRLLLDVLTRADPRLLALARAQTATK